MTLGEWRDLAEAVGSKATEVFDQKIATQGRDEKVIAPESQMMFLIASMIPKETPDEPGTNE